MNTDATKYLQRWGSMLQRRQMIDGDVQAILSYLQPQKASVNQQRSPGVEGNTDGLYDVTAVDANMVLAAGLMSTATPTSSRWATLSYPGRKIQGRPVSSQSKRWLQEATEEVMDEIARSTFYTECHEAHLDRSSAGTCFLFMDEGKESMYRFEAIPFGDYAIAENFEGRVDTVYRKFKITARQAEEQFGRNALPPSIKQVLEAANQDQEKTFEFLHCIEPRMVRDAGKIDPENKPWASIYVACEDKAVVREGGYDEFPGAVSRYLKWPGTLWGYGPGFVCLPTARQINFIERQLDALAEKAAFPPILAPSNLLSRVDSRSLGVTIFDENFPQALPREWQQLGRYDIGKDRVETKRDFIRKLFHNDLFQMFGNVEREITAYQAMQLASEKLDLISPSFTRFTGEMLNPIILRGFRMKLRAGEFGQPPEELLARGPGGQVGFIEPKVVYTSKLALAIKAAENRSFLELQQVIAGVAQIQPEVLDNFDMDAASRGIAENLGVPTAWTRSAEDVTAIREQRAEAMQAQAAAESAPGLAKAAKDVDSMSAEGKNRLAEAGLN